MPVHGVHPVQNRRRIGTPARQAGGCRNALPDANVHAARRNPFHKGGRRFPCNVPRIDGHDARLRFPFARAFQRNPGRSSFQVDAIRQTDGLHDHGQTMIPIRQPFQDIQRKIDLRRCLHCPFPASAFSSPANRRAFMISSYRPTGAPSSFRTAAHAHASPHCRVNRQYCRGLGPYPARKNVLIMYIIYKKRTSYNRKHTFGITP